jgi:hypothetical protein
MWRTDVHIRLFPVRGRLGAGRISSGALRRVPLAVRWVDNLEEGMFAATGGGTVFGRRQVKTHNELMRAEFGEGFDHLRMGAAHAAETAAAVLAPRLDQVLVRLEPTFDRSKSMARSSARQADKIARRATGKKKKKEPRMAKRWPMVVGGLMVAGAAVGAVGALMSRRHKNWSDYGSTGPESGFRDESLSFADSPRSTTSSVADTARDKASDVLGQMNSATEPTGGAAGTSSPNPTSTRTGEFTTNETRSSGTATGASRNTRP